MSSIQIVPNGSLCVLEKSLNLQAIYENGNKNITFEMLNDKNCVYAHETMAQKWLRVISIFNVFYQRNGKMCKKGNVQPNMKRKRRNLCFVKEREKKNRRRLFEPLEHKQCEKLE